MPVHVQIWELEPGSSEGDHTHPTDGPADNWEELYYGLSGTGAITIDGVRHALVPDDAVLVPAGVDHGLYVTSDESLRILLIFGKPPAARRAEQPPTVGARPTRTSGTLGTGGERADLDDGR